MSTLTSTQMNIKRSSTRVHGPPGGASQLTFGPGGFGTRAPNEPDAENRDMVQPRHDFLPQKPGMMQPQRAPSNNQQQSHPNYSRPPPTGYAPPPTAYAPPSTAYSAYGPPPTAKPPQSAYAPNVYIHQSGGPDRPQTTGWGRGASAASQPPLTSSKRDQNWEKKRRQWLMRKSGGTPNYSNQANVSFTPNTSSGNSYGNPPSPLSKLMNNAHHDSNSRPPYQQQFNPPPHQQFNHNGVPPQSYQAPPPTGYNRGIPSSSSGSMPYMNRGNTPSTAGSNYMENGSYQAKPSVFQQSGAGQFPQYPTGNQQRVPPTQSSTRSSRQAPGGTSNWSPYT